MGLLEEAEMAGRETYFMYELLDASAERIFSLYGRKRKIYSFVRAVSRVVDKISKVILLLQLNFPMYICHGDIAGRLAIRET